MHAIIEKQDLGLIRLLAPGKPVADKTCEQGRCQEEFAGLEARINHTGIVLDVKFSREKEKYGLDSQEAHPGFYLILNLDSSARLLCPDIYKETIEPVFEKLDYSEFQRIDFKQWITDLYANAVIFAHRAGKKSDYVGRRYLKHIEPPSPEELEKNAKKTVCIEILANREYAICRVTDTGPGIDEKWFDENIRRYAVVPDNFPELPQEEQLNYLMGTGRGLALIELLTKRQVLFTKTYSFSTSFIRYKSDGNNLAN